MRSKRREKRMKGKQLFACFLFALFAITTVNASVVEAATSGVRLKVGDTITDDVYVTKNTAYALTKGATENVLVSNNSKNEQNIGFFMSAQIADKSNHLKVAAGYRNYDGSKYGLATTTAQAKAYEKAHPGETVIGAINADFYNMQTGQTLGALVLDGKVYNAGNGRNSFVILKDGSAAICDSNGLVVSAGSHQGQTIDWNKDVKEAVGGDMIIARDGKVAQGIAGNEYGDLQYSRSSVGIKKDGTVVTYVTRGKLAPTSYGETYTEIAAKLVAAGCDTVIALDGGGSATSVSKREGEKTLTVRNSPSDGSERNVASTLFIVSDAKEDGTFDHASISPVDEYYTPGHKVTFEAFGVDAYGNTADIPENYKWELSADSKEMGSIDQNGVFTSNGKLGDVTAQIVVDGKECGSTTIHMVEPDEINFESESLSLDFGEKSDLGLYARYKNCDVNFYDGDLMWMIKSKTDGKSDDEIGSMSGNTFVAQSKDQTMQYDAEIYVTYVKKDGTSLYKTVKVSIGRMPEILYDFELDENGKALQAAHYSWGMTTNNGSGPYYFKNYEKDELEVATSGSYRGEPVYDTIKQPFTFTGNFDTAVPAADIFRADGYTFYLWPNGSLNDRSVGSADVNNKETGQVRFGDYALDVEYDFTSYNGTSNSNIYLRYCGEPITIDGNPKELGMWVYAPEGTHNFRIAVCVETWNGSSYTTQNIFLKTQDGDDLNYKGINWSGWKYCYADLESCWKYVDAEHPMKILPGSGLLWINYTPMGKDENGNTVTFGGKYKGHLYFDNMRVVYGSTQDDLIDPVISKITANNIELKKDGSTVLDNGNITFAASYDDPEGKNRSGIDPSKVVVLIDGEKVTLNDSSETYAYLSKQLSNGTHDIRVIVQDVFGNQVSETREFTVKDENNKAASIKLSGADSTYIGSTYKLTLSNKGGIKEINTNLKIDEEFGEPTVTFANGFTGNATYDKGILKIKAKSDSGEDESGTVALIKFKVPTTLSEEKSFTYGLMNCSYVDSNGTWTSSLSTKTVKIQPYYKVSADVMVAGQSGAIYVTDVNGNKVPDAEIYKVEEDKDILLGTTDENGTLTTKKLCKTGGEEFTIYAMSERGYSYRYKGTTANVIGNEDGTPSQIAHNVAANGDTGENITWWSNPVKAEKKAIVQYKVDGTDQTAKEAVGVCEVEQFAQSKDAVFLNRVNVTGLTAGTTYTYRVGDGSHWSEWKTFSTTNKNAKETNFFVLGDTQLSGNLDADQEAIDMMKTIGADVKDAEFGIQTGDYVDNAGYSGRWAEIQDAFYDAFGTKDILHVMGNHEYYGEGTGNTSAKIFNLSKKDYYSVEYGNVYIASISNDADMAEVAAWLKKDAKASDCQWKILTVHQPAYYTNAKGGSEGFNEKIPPMAEAAGIQMVFSGHDHSYARTEPLTSGKIDKDSGITYFICGDLGEKSREADYAIATADKFSYAKVTQDYTAIYLTVTANEDSMKVTVKDLDGSIVDEYELESACSKAGGHDMVYDAKDQTAVCQRCGKVDKQYTGLIRDKDKNTYYLLKGVKATGWQSIGDEDGQSELYYFNKDGISQKVTITEDVKTTCTVRGYRIYHCDTVAAGDEKDQKIVYTKAAGHEYDENRVCKVCGWKEVSLDDCDFSLNYKSFYYTGKEVKPITTLTYKGTKFRAGYDYKTTYSNNIDCGIATITITPVTKFMGDVINDKGSLAPTPASMEKTFVILPQGAKNTKAAAAGTTSVKVSWKKIPGVDGYGIYRYNSTKGKYVLAGTVGANASSYTMKNLSSGYAYTVQVKGYVNVDGKKVYGKSASAKAVTKPGTVTGVTAASNASKTMSVTWTKKTGSGYEIRYATSSTFKTYRTITIKNSTTLRRTISGLTKGKKYYVRVRAYKSYTGCTTAYGNWSATKSVTVK